MLLCTFFSNQIMNTAEQKKLLIDLEKEESEILSELADFAQKDPNVKGGFIVPFPNEGNTVDENAREIAEFERMKVLKDNLQKKLNDIRATIKKIKEGIYGKCETCSVSIGSTRLKAMPAARFCIDCAKIKSREA